jgi:hypothetical protein
MRDNTTVIDAPGLVPRVTLATENQEMTTMRKPSGLVEAAVRVLGTMLVLYRHYVPNSEYYKVHDIVLQ